MCSTPFGITEFGTALLAVLKACKGKVCSTPFGITEFGTDLLGHDH